ncbi:hypothetical protein BYZ73_15130 [Rhodovulum viride]|uniref:CD-NTase associated protein 4-like DNA endonuclease domain-containing protein n=1 Tax=Rhodovulum viride TaxID=1231134 RepID=A0ABX9DF95_9RHOB|nr:dsDNA nuclease domain-containing protein [Rhodovulum viride]RAP40409.1 hypothetical protein BYZ73_15130 [Rhodovulum viride]
MRLQSSRGLKRLWCEEYRVGWYRLTESEPQAQQVTSWPSVDSVPPVEEGGPIARRGFTYQDEIAVGFLLEMIADEQLTKIHFESHDDLVLVRSPMSGTTLRAEYVQVKAGEPEKLWSVADVCQRKKKEVGTSIFEISLGRDRHAEISSFRIVTLRPIMAALMPLSYPFGAEGRDPSCETMVSLQMEMDSRCPGCQSRKRNGSRYWLENCFWDVRHDFHAVERANRLQIFELAQKSGQPLLIEQVDVLLNEMRAWVKGAGDAKWHPDKAKKIVHRDQAVDWWRGRLTKLAQVNVASGGALAEKMADASIPSEVLAMAIELRLDYAAKVRTPTYMPPEESEDLQARVKSTVQSLSADLAAGILDLSGAQFHALCLQKLDALNNERPVGARDQGAFLKGCLYDIADRCLLRFNGLRT